MRLDRQTQMGTRIKMVSCFIARLLLQLSLPEGVTIDVIVSSVVTPNHIFVQQPTHSMYALLERQNQCMLLCYSQDGIVPQLPRPLEGKLCSDWLKVSCFLIG